MIRPNSVYYKSKTNSIGIILSITFLDDNEIEILFERDGQELCLIVNRDLFVEKIAEQINKNKIVFLGEL